MSNSKNPSKKFVQEHTRASLLALAIGDALGATNEFKTRQQIEKSPPVTDLIGGGWLNLPPGEITDDTEMTRCVLQSYAHGYSLEDVAARFLAWLESGPRDAGILTRQSLEHIKRGLSPREAGRKAWEQSGFNSAGNGALMRCAPSALLRLYDREARVLETLEVARVTHFDERCVESSLWLNATVAALLLGNSVDRALKLARAELDWAREHCDLAALGPNDDVLEWVERATTMSIDELDTSGFTLATAQVAAWALLHSPSLEAGLVLITNQGGDADTTGAVTGALLGARFGMEGIPQRWLEQLRCRVELEETLQHALAQVANATD